MLFKKPNLTKRELEVLNLIIEGLTNKEIAQRLSISEHTSKAHIKSIMSKFKVKSKLAAAIFAIKMGIINYLE